MIDFHSHILPGMDDGSKSIEESVAMLNALSEQGICKVAATPHFYANDESVSEFLSRRQASFNSLPKNPSFGMPEILLGAEVRYYEGISRLENLKDLCLQRTKLLLIEMPECRWSEYAIRELADLAGSGGIIPVLAHIERCIFQQKKETLFRLLQNGVLMQINAEFLNGFFSRRKAVKLLKNNQVHFLGSDCHNMQSRPPDIGKAYQTVYNKLGGNFAEAFKDFINEFIETYFSKG